MNTQIADVGFGCNGSRVENSRRVLCSLGDFLKHTADGESGADGEERQREVEQAGVFAVKDKRCRCV